MLILASSVCGLFKWRNSSRALATEHHDPIVLPLLREDLVGRSELFEQHKQLELTMHRSK
jgi:hypothetical protein